MFKSGTVARVPKLSVIVPIYNVEQYVAQCIEFLIAQTLHDIGIVLVDDASSDGSVAIAEKYVEKDGRLKLLHHDKSGGVSAARNAGIRHSTAPLVMFCDSDDFVEPDFCEQLYNGIESSGTDMARCGTKVIYETDRNRAEEDAR
jgi:glycosyltransferase involved in cell wall biosynthesis